MATAAPTHAERLAALRAEVAFWIGQFDLQIRQGHEMTRTAQVAVVLGEIEKMIPED